MKRFKTILGAILGFLLAPVARYAERQFVFSALPQAYPDIMQWLNNLSINPNSIELIEQPLYDYQVYATAGTTSKKFFNTSIGGGSGASGSAAPGQGGNAKSLADTNLQGPGGSLPSPMAYWVSGIEVVVDPGSVTTANTWAVQAPGVYTNNAAALPATGDEDVNAILSTGSLTLNISQKPFFQDAPLYMFPPSATLTLDAAVSLGNDTANTSFGFVYSKLRSVGRLRTLNPGIGIMTSQNFDVTLAWPSVVATPSGNNARIGVRLTGFMMRAAQ